MEAILYRRYNNGAPTTGRLVVFAPDLSIAYQCATVELPWLGNMRGKSCIPEGVYDVVPRWSKAHRSHFHITGVDGRELILIHVANSIKELRGCIAPGLRHGHVDADGLIDVQSSTPALASLRQVARQGFKLRIISMEGNAEW